MSTTQENVTRSIYGQELKLVFAERFQETPPASLAFKGSPVLPENFINAVTNGLYKSSATAEFDKSVIVIDEYTAKVGIKFTETTPACDKDKFLYVTLLANVSHHSSDADYHLDVIGIADVQEILFGTTMADVLDAVTNVTPKKAKCFRGTARADVTAPLLTLYTLQGRAFTNANWVTRAQLIAEKYSDQILAAGFLSHEVGLAIWKANEFRYHASEDFGNAEFDRATALIKDIELMFYLPQTRQAWLEAFYIDTRNRLQAEGTDEKLLNSLMMKEAVAMIDTALGRSELFHTTVFNGAKSELTDSLNHLRNGTLRSLQQELIRLKDTEKEDEGNSAPTGFAPVVKEVAPIDELGEKLDLFSLRYGFKEGDVCIVRITYKEPDKDNIFCKGTIAAIHHDLELIEFDLENGDAVGVYFRDWNRNEEAFDVTFDTAEGKLVDRTELYRLPE